MEIDKATLNGIYLVVDPAMEHHLLRSKIKEALEGGVNLLQIWNHWPTHADRAGKEAFIQSVTTLARPYSVPVLINDEWSLLKSTSLDGVHFDEVPENMTQIRTQVGRNFLAGITCTNDLTVVDWAEQHRMNYISFCALFPSPSVSSCEIVRPETVREARQRTNLPIFLSGGINLQNMKELGELNFDGVAVISGILAGDAVRQKTSIYQQALNDLNINS